MTNIDPRIQRALVALAMKGRHDTETPVRLVDGQYRAGEGRGSATYATRPTTQGARTTHGTLDFRIDTAGTPMVDRQIHGLIAIQAFGDHCTTLEDIEHAPARTIPAAKQRVMAFGALLGNKTQAG